MGRASPLHKTKLISMTHYAPKSNLSTVTFHCICKSKLTLKALNKTVFLAEESDKFSS